MTPAFTTRRRAEEFDALVEGASTAGDRDARYADFLELVSALRDIPQPEPAPSSSPTCASG